MYDHKKNFIHLPSYTIQPNICIFLLVNVLLVGNLYTCCRKNVIHKFQVLFIILYFTVFYDECNVLYVQQKLCIVKKGMLL